MTICPFSATPRACLKQKSPEVPGFSIKMTGLDHTSGDFEPFLARGVLLHKLQTIIIFAKYFAFSQNIHTFAVPNSKGSQIEIWCNGSTTDSGSVSEGSSPSISTKFYNIMAG